MNDDLEKLYKIIENALSFTKNVHVYGCSIFRDISEDELKVINNKLNFKYQVNIEVISQEDEADYTAFGCYNNIDFDKSLCIFIGGGGSTELVFVKNKKIIDNKYFNFGVVDVTNKFPSLKDDIPSVSFAEVYEYVDNLVGNIDTKAEVLIIAGGDHLYWYNNAQFKLLNNDLYESENQKFMITKKMSDNYDREAFTKSLDKIRANSDNPKWFDCSRTMKLITNLISQKVDAKYIIPTKINMEDGLRKKIEP